MAIDIQPRTFTDKNRSGNMYINEEQKQSLRRETNTYMPIKAEIFPPFKKPIADCKWAFKLEPMTSSLTSQGDMFEWKLPRNFIQEATQESLEKGLLKMIRTNTYSTKLPNIQLCFFNGHTNIKTPEYGNMYKFNTELQIEDKINTVGVRYAENTLEVTMNDTFGINSYLSSANHLPSLNRLVYLKP